MPIEIEGLDELKVTIHEIEKAIDPSIELAAKFGDILLADVDKTFATNGRGNWKVNAPSTREGIPGILQFEGKLRASMGLSLTRNSATVKPSNSVYKYAAVNHYGSKSGRIPARPFMYISQEAQEKLMATYEGRVNEAMKK